jgi:hypothetical protein
MSITRLRPVDSPSGSDQHVQNQILILQYKRNDAAVPPMPGLGNVKKTQAELDAKSFFL